MFTRLLAFAATLELGPDLPVIPVVPGVRVVNGLPPPTDIPVLDWFGGKPDRGQRRVPRSGSPSGSRLAAAYICSPRRIVQKSSARFRLER